MSTPLVTGRTVALSKVKLLLRWEEYKTLASFTYPRGDRIVRGLVKYKAVTKVGRGQEEVYLPFRRQDYLWHLKGEAVTEGRKGRDGGKFTYSPVTESPCQR